MAKAKKMLSIAMALLVTVGSYAPAVSAATKKVDYYQIALTNINKYLKPQLTATKQSQSEEDLKLLQSYYRSLKIHMSKITDAKQKAAISKMLMELSQEIVAVTAQVNAQVAAANAVEEYELTVVETMADVTKAEALEAAARDLVQDIADRTVRVALMARIDTKKAAVDKVKSGFVNAEATLKAAEDAVKAYEDAKLTTLDEIKAAKELAAKATDAVAKVADADKKAALEKRIADQKVKVDAKEVELLPLEVKEVKSENLKEIVVVFNQDVNMVGSSDTTNYPSSALNTANYKIAGAAPASVVKIDNRTVMLTASTAFTAGSSVAVDVLNIKNAALNKTVKTYAVAFIAADTIAPTATATVDALRNVTITFSEPMSTVGVVYVGTTQVAFTLDANGKKATATLGTSFEAGKSYDIKLYGAKDLKGNYMTSNPYTIAITVPVDNTKPGVAKVEPTSDMTKVRVTFTEPVQDQDVTAGVNYATLTFKDLAGNTLATATLNAVVANTDNLTYEVAIPSAAGLGTFNYRYVNVEVSAYKDLVGNAGDNATVRVFLQKDTVAPTLKEVKLASDRKSLYIFFDEMIQVPVGTNQISVEYTANDGVVYDVETITITDADRIDKDGTTAGDLIGLKVIPTTWRNTDLTLKQGTYTVKVKANAVADTSAQANLIKEVSQAITVGAASPTADTTAPTITVSYTTGRVITVTANEDLTLPNTSNFKIDGASLPEGTRVYFYLNKQTVKIELPYESITLTAPRVFSYSLADVAGNVKAGTAELSLVENVRPQMSAAIVGDVNTVVITATENLSGTVANADFEVYVNGTKLTSGYAVALNGSNAKQIIITFTNALGLNDTVKVKYIGTGLADANGNPLVNAEINVTR